MLTKEIVALQEQKGLMKKKYIIIGKEKKLILDLMKNRL